MLQPFETILQRCCNAVLRQKSSLRIVPCNITFNNDDGDGSENVTVKVNSCFSKFCRVYFNFPENVKCRPVFLDLNFWGPYSSLKRDRKIRRGLCASSMKVMLHETIRNNDFKCNTALQHCYDILTLCCAKNPCEIRHFHVVVV